MWIQFGLNQFLIGLWIYLSKEEISVSFFKLAVRLPRRFLEIPCSLLLPIMKRKKYSGRHYKILRNILMLSCRRRSSSALWSIWRRLLTAEARFRASGNYLNLGRPKVQCVIIKRSDEILASWWWLCFKSCPNIHEIFHSNSGLLSFKKPETLLWTIAKYYYYYYHLLFI